MPPQAALALPVVVVIRMEETVNDVTDGGMLPVERIGIHRDVNI